jgi:ABC-type multidrug transport system fused ATPase/permease subunit
VPAVPVLRPEDAGTRTGDDAQGRIAGANPPAFAIIKGNAGRTVKPQAANGFRALIIGRHRRGEAVAPETNGADSSFKKACGYLNFNAKAKWIALVAGAGTGVVYVLLLGVLWLFSDWMVSRGRVPDYLELTPLQHQVFARQWADLPEEERRERLHAAGFDLGTCLILSSIDEPAEAGEAAEWMWEAQARHFLRTAVSPAAEARVFEGRSGSRPVPEEDESFWDAFAGTPVERVPFNDADFGVLSLVVREKANGKLFTPLPWLARWNRWMWNAPPEGPRPLFPPYLTGLFLIAVVLVVISAALTLLMHEMAARATIEATTRLRRAVYHHTFRLGTLAVRALGPSEAVSILTRHVEALHDALYNRLTVYFREPILFGLLLVFAFVVHPWLALAFLAFALVVWWVGAQMFAYFRRRTREATNQAAERLTIIRESLMLMRLVKCYLMEQFNQARVERQLARYAQAQLVRHRGEAIYQPLLLFLGLLCALVLLYVGALNVMYGRLSVAGAVVLAVALVSLYWPVQRSIEMRRYLKRGREAADQVFRFLERRGEVGQVVGAEFLPPLSREIEFDKVSLRDSASGRLLLEDVSITIPANKRIGLIGADSLEKQALVYLIPRLLDPTAGEIRIDQHNLRWVTLDSLRAQIGLVMMQNLVFHDTVANNIGCGDSAYTLPQIIEASKIAHAHHFIQKLPQGYETPIGELGHSLTVSEQFRIALARAILRDPALLIIEEPEMPLDEQTKDQLDDTLTRILPGRTAIFLPHRISTIRSCDRLYLLSRGRVVATGQHKDLLTGNPLYRHLHYLEFNEMDEQV